MYYVPITSSIQDAVKILNAAISKDAQKLVKLGVATGVEVSVEYLGSNRVSATIDVVATSGATGGKINMSAQMLDNAWVWQ